MKTFEYTITDPVGIHTRPAGQLAALAKTFSSTATVSGNGKTVSAKKMIALMSLGIKSGQTVEITCEGEDEEACSTALQEFLTNHL